jgi:hypothetical protein
MPGWIEEEAKKRKELRTQVEQRQQWQLQKEEKIREKVPVWFQALLTAVQKDVEEFNETYPGVEERLGKVETMGDAAFQVVRNYEPLFLAEVRMKESSISYKVEFRREGDPTLSSVQGSFQVQMLESGETQLFEHNGPISPEKASEKLLRPALI